MTVVKRIVVLENELPMELVVVGCYGRSKKYTLNPAGKGKLGARLGSPKEQVNRDDIDDNSVCCITK